MNLNFGVRDWLARREMRASGKAASCARVAQLRWGWCKNCIFYSVGHCNGIILHSAGHCSVFTGKDIKRKVWQVW